MSIICIQSVDYFIIKNLNSMNYDDFDQITMKWKQTEDSLSHHEDQTQTYSLKSSHVNPSVQSEMESKSNANGLPIKPKIKSHAP